VQDNKARDAILESIERRWLKTEQNIFIAGIHLNPFHKARPFRAAPFSTVGGLYNLLHYLWKRFYYEDPPAELYGEYRFYSLKLSFMNYVRLVSNLGLKITLDRYGVPREGLPTIAERALGGTDEIHSDVVAFLGIVFLSMKLASRKLESLYE